MWVSVVRVALALLLVVPAVAAAQQSAGGIAGVVRDASGGVVPGVTVEAASPALIARMRSTVTDEQGQYRIVDLRPGTYSVTFTLTGFSTVKREGIELTGGFTAPVNVELRPGSLEETVTVTGSSPLVDVQSVMQVQVTNREALEALPTGEFFSNIAQLIPGLQVIQLPLTNAQQDVGGSAGWAAIKVQVHGGLATDQQMFLNGFSITNLSGEGAQTSEVPIEGTIQEYNIATSGHPAEAETGGVRVNLVPRAGGNSFSGGTYFNFTNESLQSNNLSPAVERLGLKTITKAKSIWATSPFLGGPLVQDKAWFFAAGQRAVTDNYTVGFHNADSLGWKFVPDTSRRAVNDQHNWAWSTRFTYQPNRRDRFNGYFEYNETCYCHFGLDGARSPDGVVRLQDNHHTFELTWTAPITNQFLIEVGASRFDNVPQDLQARPDGSDHPINDIGIGLLYSQAGSASGYRGQTDHFKGSMTYVSGEHALKFGTEIRLPYHDPAWTRIPGNASYVLLNGRTSSVTYSPGQIISRQYVRPNLGIYLQDRWTLSRFTADVGVRFDWLRSGYPDQTLPVDQYRPQPVSFPGSTVLNWKDLDPRIGIAYDLFGNGKTAIKGNIARYVNQQVLPLTRAVNPVTTSQLNTTRSWTDSNGDFIVQGNPLNPAANLELGAGSNANFGQPVIQTRIDPEYARGFGVRPHIWEMSAGIQHELMPGMAVNATYYRKTYANFQVTQNRAVAPSDYTTYCVNAPGDPRLPGEGGQSICGLFDLNNNRVGQIDNLITSSTKFGKQQQHWNGGDILVNARLPRGMMLQGGLSAGRTMWDNCEIAAKIGGTFGQAATGAAIGNPSQRFCHVESPVQTSFRMSGTYPLPWDTMVSAVVQTNPGPEILASGSFVNNQISPSLGRNLSSGTSAAIALVEPGTLYNKRINQVDFRVAKTFKVRNVRMQGSVDLFNALNAGQALAQNNTYGTNGAAWQLPTTVLVGRLVKFQVRMNF